MDNDLNLYSTSSNFYLNFQVASLKDTILVKDEEIEKLQLLKDLKNVYPGANSENVETA